MDEILDELEDVTAELVVRLNEGSSIMMEVAKLIDIVDEIGFYRRPDRLTSDEESAILRHRLLSE